MTNETPPTARSEEVEPRDCVSALVLEYESALHAGRTFFIEDKDVHNLTPDEINHVRESCRRLDFLYSLATPLPETAPHRDSTGVDQLDSLKDQSDFRVDPAALFGVLGSYIGRFEILRGLGMGGHGIVFLAKDPRLDRLVALKLPRPEVLVSSSLRRRFVLEGRVAALLSHPNIVTVFESGESGAICYLIQDYVPGPSLDVWLQQHPQPVESRVAANFMVQLTSGVALAHSHKILHRDIKPSNILLAPRQSLPEQIGLIDFVPKLADFGTAKFAQLVDATVTQGIVGTPAYMAPEQTAGKKAEIGEATDIYALGAVLYEILTCRRVMRKGDNSSAKSEVVSPRVFVPSIERDLEAICLKCLRNHPTERYVSADALEADLRNFLGNNRIIARHLTVAERVLRWSKMNPAMTLLSGIILLSGLIVLGLTVKANRNLRDFNQRIQTEQQRADESHQKAEKQQQQALDAYAGLINDVIDKLHTVNGTQAFRDEVFGIIDRGLPTIIDPAKLQDRRSTITYLHYLTRLSESQEAVPDEARRSIDLARSIATGQIDRSPADSELLAVWAKILSRSASINRLQSNIESCYSDSQACIQACERWKAIEPENQQCTDLMSQSYSQLGYACTRLERYREALANHQKATSLLEELRTMSPDYEGVMTKLVQSYRFAGDVAYRELGEIATARTAYDQAWNLTKPELDRSPIHFRTWLNVSAIQRGIGDVALDQSDFSAADQASQMALDAALKAAETDADSTSRVLHELAVGYERRARLASAKGDFNTAHAAHLMNIKSLDRLFQAFPTNWFAELNYELVAVDMLKLGDLPRSLQSIKAAIRVLEDRPIDRGVEMGRELAWIRANRILSEILSVAGEWTEAKERLEAQAGRLMEFRSAFPKLQDGRFAAIHSWIARGNLFLKAEFNAEAARDSFQKALELIGEIPNSEQQPLLVRRKDDLRRKVIQRCELCEHPKHDEGFLSVIASDVEASLIAESNFLLALGDIKRGQVDKAIDRADALTNAESGNSLLLFTAAKIYGEVCRRDSGYQPSSKNRYLEKVRSIFTKLDSSNYFASLEAIGELRISAAFAELSLFDASNEFILRHRVPPAADGH